MKTLLLIAVVVLFPSIAKSQPEVPMEEWKVFGITKAYLTISDADKSQGVELFGP